MRRILLTILVGFVLLAGGAYTAYWFITANILEDIVASWVEQRRDEGYVVEVAQPHVTGFPTAFHMDLGEPVIEAPLHGGGWRWEGSRLLGEAKITNPWHILFSTPGHHELKAPGPGGMQTFTADAADVAGEFKLEPEGGLQHATLDLAGVTLSLPNQEPVKIEQARLRLVPGPLAAAAPTAASATAHLQLVGLSLPQDRLPGGLDSRVDRVELAAMLRGLIPPGAPGDALRAWRDAGGVVEVEKLLAEWGPLRFSGDGTFALDERMQPIGAMSAAIKGLEPAAEQLAAAGLISPKDARLVTLAGTALARPADDGGTEVRMPLRLQQQTLSLGPVPLLRLPTVRWQ